MRYLNDLASINDKYTVHHLLQKFDMGVSRGRRACYSALSSLEMTTINVTSSVRFIIILLLFPLDAPWSEQRMRCLNDLTSINDNYTVHHPL